MNKKFINGREPRRKYWDEEIALYRGDDLIDSGTIQEIADRRGVQKMTIRYYLTPIGHRRADARKKSESGIRGVRV